MRRLIALVALVVGFAMPLTAQTVTATLQWNMAEAPPVAQGFTYALKDGAGAAVPLTGIACTTVSNATQCSAVMPTPAAGTHSYTLTASSPMGSATSDPLTGVTPGKPTTITITITIK